LSKFENDHFEYIPFGSGRRVCPYGVAIVEVTLASFLYLFEWELSSGMVPENLDMDEAFGIAFRRKNNLCLIPIPYHILHLLGKKNHQQHSMY
jgi:hypothetical protein